MKLKTYQAYSMAEALAAVKRDLGSDAVILNTRSFQRGGMLGLRRKTIIEVTATPAQAAVEAKPRPAGAAAAQRAYANKPKPTQVEETVVTETDRIRTRRLAQAIAAKYEQRAETESAHDTTSLEATKALGHGPLPPAANSPIQTVTSASANAASIAAPAGQTTQQSAPEQASVRAQSQPNTAARRFILTSDASPSSSASSNVRSVVSEEMQSELAAIKSMVGQVLQRTGRSSNSPSPAMPAKLFDMYLQLIGQDISEDLADTVINEVRDVLTSTQLNDAECVRAAVLERLASHIPVAHEPVAPRTDDGRPLTIALIGPTGVGKTTTLAKLAATFKLRQNCKVGLITSDTYRIAAVDQLRTYANIIGLPLKVALTPGEMNQAVHALQDCDVILIDTAGRGQNDSAKLDELGEFLAAAAPHEVHLVLSSTANEKVLMREAEAFSAVGVHKIVLTKLDEAVSFGMLINVVRKIGKELSFLTTGQEVPTHIEVGRADRLADLILGGEVHA